MLDYNKKKIEFCVYEYPYENDKLKFYKIREIEICHSESKIEIIFSKKDAIIGVGICLTKFSQIAPIIQLDTSLFLSYNNKELNMPLDKDIILEKISKLGKEKIKLYLTSKYNLLSQKNIIAYYNLDDEYEDTTLEEILNQVGTPF